MAYIIHVSCSIWTSLTVLDLVHSFSLVKDVYEPFQTVLRFNYEIWFMSDPKLRWKITKNAENRRFYL